MRTSFPPLVLLAAAVFAAAGCSLLLSFDQEGQPCDSAGNCLPGYGCVVEGTESRCHKNADAGAQECRCKAGERCRNKKCVPNNCQFRQCGVSQYCSDDAGIPSCRDVPKGELGHTCIDDGQCAADGINRVCYRGAVQINSYGGALRNGACVETCPAGGLPCLADGGQRISLSLGADAGTACVCVTNNIFNPCLNNEACKDDGLICTVFDHPAVGPSTVCDSPATGAEIGEPCVLNTQLPDGGSFGNLCKNGLCAPRVLAEGEQGVCGELCDVVSGVSTCTAPKQCVLAEFSVVGSVRFVPMCVDAPTRCRDCIL
ncbi:MAG: hypothetical protein ACYC8T_36355, partial [Myxococcaceae bacterium]